MNKTQFYQRFPKFDWNFYTSNYQDLNHLNNEDKAINHYWNNGQHESRRTHTIIEKNKQPMIFIDPKDILGISKQCHVSKGLHMFQTRLFEKFNLTSYSTYTTPSIFFGIYTDEDLMKIRDHHELKIIIWGGEDANPSNTHSLATMNEIKRVPNTIHLSISKCIYKRLLTQNIKSILINFNLVDTTLFKPLKNNELGNKIFIFNGQTKGRTHIYGEKYYLKVIKKLPQFKYIFSNELNVTYKEMPHIYKLCFIMLRLTHNDGNANSVQECETMNIPVIHNQSNYGLKWKNVEDIVNHISTANSIRIGSIKN